MMATAAELRVRLDALEAARDGGQRRVRVGNTEIEYRTDAELAAAIAALEKRLAVAEGRRAPRFTTFLTDKGF